MSTDLKLLRTYDVPLCQQAASEIERLRAEVEAARIEAFALVTAMAKQVNAPPDWTPLPDVAGMLTQISNMVAGLRAENEALRKEAERYRWLRRDDLPYEKCAHLYDTHSNEELDAAIDAAMEKEKP